MISIITPVLNGAAFIEKNLDSISQLGIPFEHILVDGGSEDGTLEIAAKYPHVRVIRQIEKKGMYAAIDEGIRQSKGDYIAWINADDMIIPEEYARFYNIAVNKNAGFAYSNAFHFFLTKKDIKKIYAKHFTRFFLKAGVFPFVQSSVLFKREVYNKVGGLRFDKFRIIGDRDLFQRMALDETISFAYVPLFTSMFLMHGDSLLHRNEDLRRAEQAMCVKSSNSPFYGLFFRISNLIREILW